MNWEDLPIEIRIEILAIHFYTREQACKKIQKNWKKYFAPIVSAIDIALKLEVDFDGIFLVMWPETANILEFCARVVSAKHHRGFWKFIVNHVQIALHLNEDTGGPFVTYYNRTKQACQKLIEKLERYEVSKDSLRQKRS